MKLAPMVSFPKRLYLLFIVALAAVVALLFYSTVASAAPGASTWTLTGVTFSDGGTATGTFDFDANTQAVSNVSISVSGGNVGVFPPAAYTSLGEFSFFGNPQKTFFFASGIRQLRLTPATALTNAGGTVQLNLNTAFGGSGGTECFNCAPFRLFTAGSLVGGPAADLAITAMKIMPNGAEKMEFDGTITGATVDASAGPVSLKMFANGVEFYPESRWANPIAAFDAGNPATISSAEKQRTNIQSFHIDGSTGAVHFVDTQTNIVQADYSSVTVELTVNGVTTSKVVGLTQGGGGKWEL